MVLDPPTTSHLDQLLAYHNGLGGVVATMKVHLSRSSGNALSSDVCGRRVNNSTTRPNMKVERETRGDKDYPFCFGGQNICKC